MRAPDVGADVPIRDPVLRGRQSIAALWFPVTWFDTNTRAARLLQYWQPGATALRFDQGDLLCYAVPIEASCEELTGWPLQRAGGALCSAPLSDAESAVSREGDIWIVSGAAVLTLYKRDGVPLDPSTWLATGHLSLHDTYDCRLPAQTPVVLDLESRPLREVLGNVVAPAGREQAEFLAALQHARRGYLQGAPREWLKWMSRTKNFIIGLAVMTSLALAVGLGEERGAVFLWTLGLVACALAVILRLFRRRRTLLISPRAAPRGGLPPRSKPVFPQRWRHWLAKIAMVSQLSRLVGRAHARYLRRVLGFFDEGDLKEALRYAIPVDGSGGSLGPAFGTPRPRTDLNLTRANGPTRGIQLDAELRNHLRTLYRQAFAQLDREGRIDEAVFVLAELLNARREALDYLEKHERFAQAAELSLGWDMPPDLIVRLHCLAGDWRRAVAVARRDNAFATAIVQLMKGWPDAARRLREEWGNMLVQQGDWLRAVDAVWPDHSLRDKAIQWLLTAESVGGRLAARALVQRAVLLPDTLERYQKELLDLQRNPSSWRARAAMVEALLSVGKGSATRRLATLIAPGVLADHARGYPRFDRQVLPQFAQLTDVLLQADLPDVDWPYAASEEASRRTDVLCLDAPDAGMHAILDAAPLDDQCYLLALGESGVCVVDGNGRVRTRFATPAHRLVIAFSKQVALALARRESLWRVSRLDLARKTSIDLGVLAFEFCAHQFDGINWTVIQGRHLRVFDTQDSVHRVVWQVADLPGIARALTTSADLEQILLEHRDRNVMQRQAYRLPQRALLPIDETARIEGQVHLLNQSGGMIAISVGKLADGYLCLRWQLSGESLEFRLGTDWPEMLLATGEWFVFSVPEPDGSGYIVRWVLLRTGVECVRVRWPGEMPLEMRAYGDEWLLHDGRGRLLSFNVHSSEWHTFGLR